MDGVLSMIIKKTTHEEYSELSTADLILKVVVHDFNTHHGRANDANEMYRLVLAKSLLNERLEKK